MVTTPWFDQEIPMTEAAEFGTRKVIQEHSTIGIVITTDGSITDIDREAYVEAERQVIGELKEIGKPFLVIVNSADPKGEAATQICRDLSAQYGVSCMAENCMTLEEQDVSRIICSVLYEFPIRQMNVFLPSWVDALPVGHKIREDVLSALRDSTENTRKIRDVHAAAQKLKNGTEFSQTEVTETNLGNGSVTVNLELPRALFYVTISEQSGFAIGDDGDLVRLLMELSSVKEEYDKVAEALQDVRTKGYGIVMPGKDELKLQEPEIVRQGGRYGVRLKASAPSIHMLMANVETEVSPAVGGEKSSEDIINFLLQEFEGDVSKIWESNIFGKSLYDIAGEGLSAKIKKMPEEAQKKLQETLQRIINEGSGGLICIIL